MIAASFALSIAAGLALGVVYWTGGQPQLEGLFLAVALGGIGTGMVAFAKAYLPEGIVAEPRGRVASTDEEVAAFTADFEQGRAPVRRRAVLVRLLLGAFAALGAALIFPIRSLGPRPGRGLFRTAFAGGVRLVTDDGHPIRPADVPVGGVLTVWPEGAVGAADAPTLLIRVEDPVLFGPEVLIGGTVGGLVAYSKLCTHVGCPVGLYQETQHLLLCPCHQSTFDVLRAAKPVFGPATRRLPQLPLAVGADGFLVAAGDYREPVGPGFWDRP